MRDVGHEDLDRLHNRCPGEEELTVPSGDFERQVLERGSEVFLTDRVEQTAGGGGDLMVATPGLGAAAVAEAAGRWWPG